LSGFNFAIQHIFQKFSRTIKEPKKEENKTMFGELCFF